MAELTSAHRAALTEVIARCPDRILTQLEMAVAAMPGPRAEAVRLMMAEELQDRQRRDLVFAPLLPLFRERQDGLVGFTLPSRLLGDLWRAAKRNEPELLPQLDRDDDLARMIADRLCNTAAAAVRDHGQKLWPGGTPMARMTLARVLDVAGIARSSVRKLPDWQGRVGAEQAADMKLAFRQAAAIGEDGLDCLMEVYFAHLREGLQVLRLASHAAALGSPSSTLSQGAFAPFVERVLKGVTDRADAIVDFDLSEGPQGVLAFRDRLHWLANALNEFEAVVSPRPDSVWARTLRHQKMRIAVALSERFQMADATVDALLPQEKTTLVGRMTRAVPNLTAELDDAEVEKARLLVGLMATARGPAAVIGCETERRQTAEGLTGRISNWSGEALDRLNKGDVPEGGRLARRRLQVMVDLLQLAGAKDAARTVRRRLASLGASPGISLRSA
ncbi:MULTISPECIES: hypothetical protein [unclassified Brevundimonas]|uniref:hypothetical protein n=1 Tax=unclassified Brevundimonas TaxID=2622653 RepID=UPI0025C5E313|nr:MULTISPECIES: hypothetical protein [unclassified Brevundimonas]